MKELCDLLQNDIELLGKQNHLLKCLVRSVAELLPKHGPDCYVHNIHPSYYNDPNKCSCRMPKLREEIAAVVK